jgi:DNA-binding NarL/FixJ family response regulator
MSATGVRHGILIVEDDPLVSGYVSEILHKFAFQILGCASCGPEAIALAEMNVPGLAIADIHLTGQMDGIKVAQLLRARFNVPTIFLSGVDDAETLDRARIACPLGFLKKPFLPSQLIAAIPQPLLFYPSNRSSNVEDGSTTAAEGG